MADEIKKTSISLTGRITHIYNSPDEKKISVYLNTKTIDLHFNESEEIRLGEMIEIKLNISDADIKIKPKKYLITKGE